MDGFCFQNKVFHIWKVRFKYEEGRMLQFHLPVQKLFGNFSGFFFLELKCIDEISGYDRQCTMKWYSTGFGAQELAHVNAPNFVPCCIVLSVIIAGSLKFSE